MKAKQVAALAAMVAALTTLLLLPQLLAAQVSYTRLDKPEMVHRITVNGSTLAQVAWLDRLVQCESGGDPSAINPKDSDGTPSYGLLQFKPSTFAAFSKAYGVSGTLMDAQAQRAIVLHMMRDASVNWHQQFPDCVRKLGVPPKTA